MEIIPLPQVSTLCYLICHKLQASILENTTKIRVSVCLLIHCLLPTALKEFANVLHLLDTQQTYNLPGRLQQSSRILWAYI